MTARNEKCPCGSGKKYKRCCMEQDEQKKAKPVGAIAGVLYGPLDASEDDYFHYRFLFQNTEIRSFLVAKEKRLEFDKDYNALYQNLKEAQLARKYALRELARHRDEITTGKDGIIAGHQLNVNNPINDELNLFFKDFFIRGTMATEGLCQLVNKWFGYNINFLFTDDPKKFEKGAKAFKLDRNDPRFDTHRDGWYRNFKELRDQIEHQGFRLPQIKHRVDANGKVEILVPTIGNQSIEEILDIAWNSLSNLCEEIYVFVGSLELKGGYIIWKIPEEKRVNHNWVRYKVAIPEFPEAHVSTS